MTLKRKIKKLAIANRGEVAVRIHLAAKELNIPTVLLHSEADIQSRAFRMCDETVCIGASPVGESYLNMDRVIQGALSKGCDAIHPGFGFLSENAEFAQKCLDNGIQFVGPQPEVIELMGDKVSARQAAIQSGVPVVPGYNGDDQSAENLFAEAKKIGFPLIIKAANGGGGRGLKISLSEKDFYDQLASSKRESKGAFGSDKVFLEKYLDHAKHIEFQVFGDASGKVFHLFDRECSVQRRHQKIIEEAVSPSLTKETREKMAECAVRIAQEVNYQGAGTVEFIYQDHEFFFMEMNTRLQVEHPVTECVTSLDLVKAQLRCAQGESVEWKQENIKYQGHAIECRLYAEDPYHDGMPSVGLIGSCAFPEAPGRRFEVGFDKGDVITSFYDSMIAKVIVWDEDREKAIDKMISTLKSTVIFGLQTNIPYLIEILNHPEFRSGEMTTQFISKYFSESLSAIELSSDEQEFAKKAFQSVTAQGTPSPGSQSMNSPWTVYWRGI